MAGKPLTSPGANREIKEASEEEKIITKLFDIATGVKPYGNARLCALLKSNGTIVAPNSAYQKNSIPRTRGHVKSGAGNCAEINVIDAAIKQGITIEGATIYVARAKRAHRAGPWVRGLAKPCSHCEKVMRQKGIAKIIYTTNTDDIETEHYVGAICNLYPDT